jgi:hypothetical protein
MILSILIPTIPDRVEMFMKLYNEVSRQVAYVDTTFRLGNVEVLVDSREKFLNGGPSIGKKREALVQRAQGKYLCFLDDDETISPNYIETLQRLCKQDKDVCTFRNITKLETYWTVVDMGLNFQNEEATPERMIKRSPWHICPVRSQYAKKYPFPDTSYGEDWAWFSQVLSHCRTEAKTDAILHQYNHGKHSEADKINNYVQPESGRKDNP